MDEANAIVDEIKNYASPELNDLLDAERRKFNDFDDLVGMDPYELVERLDLENDLRILQSAFAQGAFRLEINLSILDDLILEKTRSLVPSNWLPVSNAEKETTDGKFYIVDPSPGESTGFYRVSRDGQ
jgi:hypothetical protein